MSVNFISKEIDHNNYSDLIIFVLDKKAFVIIAMYKQHKERMKYMGKRIPVTVNGKLFRSIAQATKELHTSSKKIKKIINQSGSYDIVLKRRNAITINGTEYPSLKKAGQVFGIKTTEALKRRLVKCPDAEGYIFRPGKRYHNAIEVTINGETFSTLTACAEKYNIKNQTILKRYHNGIRGEELVRPTKTVSKTDGKWSRSVTIDGVEYPTISAASKAIGINYQTLVSRINNKKFERDKLSIDPSDTLGKGPSVTCRGIYYRSVSDFCATHGFKVTSFVNMRSIHKLSREETAEYLLQQKERRKCVFEGKTYDTFEAMCDAYNIPAKNVRSRLWQGWDMKRALTTSITERSGGARHRTPVSVDGQLFPSIKECLDTYKVSGSVVKRNIREGMTFEDAVKEAIKKKTQTK